MLSWLHTFESNSSERENEDLIPATLENKSSEHTATFIQMINNLW